MDVTVPKKLQNALSKAKSASEKFNAYEDLAEFFYTNQDYRRCLPYYQKLLDSAEILQDESKIAKAHRMIGEVLSLLGEYDDSIKHHHKYYDYGVKGGKKRLHEQQRALTTLGRTYLLRGNSERESEDSSKAKEFYHKAIKYLVGSLQVCQKLEKEGLVEKSEIDRMNAVSSLNKGVVYECLKNFEKAISDYDLARRVACASNLPSIQIQACLNLATVHVSCNKLTEAFNLFKEAISSAKALPEDERIRTERDILIAEEEAHMRNGDVHSARKVLQRAYRMRSNFVNQTESVERTLKSDVAMDYALRSLKSGSLSPEEECKLYERLGDGFSARKMYEHALVHYEKMLKCCKRAGLNPKPCYVSLAQTAKDLGRYKDAISYFEEEIALTDPQGASQSLLLIEKCQKSMGVSAEDRLHTVRRAWDMAEKIDDAGLKAEVLSKLKDLQCEVGDPEAENTRCLLQSIEAPLDESSSESVETEVGTQDIGEDIDLDALSDCSYDENELEFETLEATFGALNDSRPKRNSSHSKANVKWKNEKGETKLHLACMKGNVKAAKTLLEQGSDVNVADHAGWTPLHEACNHGHAEIVEMLLDHGANINIKAPEGITPLHDAASAGNFEVMDLLLKRDASVLVFTSAGHTPLDTLQEYRKREDSMTPEDQEQYNKMVNKLKDSLDKVGYVFKNKQSPENNHDFTSKQISYRKRDSSKMLKSYTGDLRRGVDVDDPHHQRNFTRDISPALDSSQSSEGSPIKVSSDDDDDDDNDEGRRGVCEYQQTMKKIRKNHSVVEEVPREQRKSIPALIPADEVVDDWLEDDIISRPSKRKRTSDFSKSSPNYYKPLSLKKKRNSGNSCSSNQASSCGSRNSIGSLGSHEDIRLSTGSENQETPEVGSSLFVDEYRDFPMVGDFVNSPERITSPENAAPNSYCSPPHVGGFQHQVTLSSYGITRKTTSPPHHVFQPPSQMSTQVTPNLINVRVEDVLLAIPITDQVFTVKLLIEEAARRFYNKKGVLPKLEIQTAEGACVAEDDPVSFLAGGSNLVGIIKDVPPIADRYKDACKFDRIEFKEDIVSVLKQCQVTQAISLMNHVLPLPVLKPVFKALSLETSLLKINFSNNSIGDEGLMDFCNNIGRLMNLKYLDLSCNGISACGVDALAQTAQKGNLLSLVELNLSFNFLGDVCVHSLSQLTAAIPGLQSLAVADCQFTKHMWDGHNHMLTLAGLKSLDLSGNMLEAKGVAGWLGSWDHDKCRRLNAETLEVLRLVGIGGSLICQELVLFLEKADMISLKELSISYSMQDDDMISLLRVLDSAPEFKNLYVPAAPELSGVTICKLLCRQPPLHRVEIKIANDKWKNVATKELIAAARAAAKGIEHLTLKGVPYIFEAAWREGAGASGSIKQGAFGIQVFSTVKN